MVLGRKRRSGKMKRKRIVITFLVCFGFLSGVFFNGSLGLASEFKLKDSISELDSAQKVFVERFITSINTDDLNGRKALLHPQCLARITGENQAFYANTFSRQLKQNIPDSYKVSIKTIAPDQELIFSRMFIYPVRPTHLIQIDYETGQNQGRSIMLQIKEENGQYFEVLGCPKAGLAGMSHKAKIAKEKDKERAKALFLELKDPLLSEIKALLKQGRKIQAWKRYSAETGESLSMAKEVVGLIEIEKDSE
jgi:hypothetical protein